MRDVAVVFARAPRLGAVKRRLAAGIGQRAALRFHAASLERLTRALHADRRFVTYVAFTPARARGRIGDRRIARFAQARGDLGARMEAVFRRFPARRVAIVGCDIPDAGPDDLARAFASLGRADAAFGPAEDGGYWLVAMGPRRPSRPFARVRWSSPHALPDTVANFARLRVAMLRTLRDVDTAEDLRAVESLARAERRAYVRVPRQGM
jgi:rSAM/selenodomain-associated transferase 1